ncbi:MAG: dihydrodipicolinate synthase family protein [Actinomycetota bacterium]
MQTLGGGPAVSQKSQITGAIAASITPLRDDGDAVDLDAIGSLVDFQVDSGLDGVLVMGTTGEGILLDEHERARVAERFVSAAAGRFRVVVHCGAQTTRHTAALAERSAEMGADAVAVISPPYFALDDLELLAHLSAAARACSPLPFYLYEFADRAGYPIPLHVIEELRAQAPNLTGLKVSDAPWERFEPYLIEGLDVFVGPERLIDRGMAGGAVGAVSALATALPELVVDAVRDPSREASDRCLTARNALQGFPFHSALKLLLAERGVPVREDVRAPLRSPGDEERRLLGATIAELLQRFAAGKAHVR